MSNQSDKQASLRAKTGKALTYEGDFEAYWDSLGVASGPFNGRMLAWINAALGLTDPDDQYNDVNAAMQAYAEANGAYNWDSLGDLNLP